MKLGIDELLAGIMLMGALVSQSPIIITQSLTLGTVGILVFIFTLLGSMIYDPDEPAYSQA